MIKDCFLTSDKMIETLNKIDAKVITNGNCQEALDNFVKKVNEIIEKIKKFDF